jgi:ATP-dependent Clp endopeptidase proteolytic subunit ClpP
MKKTWYAVKAKAGDTRAEISIYDEIGFWGVNAASFIADLKKIDASDIDVLINSPGGSVFDGLAIYNALRMHPANIHVKVMGVAASAASFIAMAGDKIVMPENTFLMVHNPMGGVFGNADEMRDWADTLDKIAASLISIYVARTGKSEDEIKTLLDAETWMTAKEAVEMGFADEMLPEMKIAANFEVEQLPANVRAAFDGAADPEDQVDPDDTPEDALADQVKALAERAGFGVYASVFAVNAKTLAEAQAAISEAREIKALCDIANASERVKNFIESSTSLSKVRETLVNAQAAADEKTHTDTAPRSNPKTTATSQPAVLKTADVWAARRNKSH